MEGTESGWDLLVYMDKGMPSRSKTSLFMSQLLYMSDFFFTLNKFSAYIFMLLMWERPSFQFVVLRIQWGAIHSQAGPHPLGCVLFTSFTALPTPWPFIFSTWIKLALFSKKKKKGLNEIIHGTYLSPTTIWILNIRM